jgi:hypothetical protein
LLGVFLSLFASILGIQSAVGLSVTVPANGTNIIDYSSNGAETVLTGYSVTPDNSGDTLLVTITLENAPSGDRLKLTTTTNLTASYGYTSGTNTFNSFSRISFTGTAANINSAFNSSFKYRSAGVAPTSAPRIRLSATLNVPGVAYFGTTDRFYKVGHFMETAGAALNNNQDDGRFCSDAGTTASNYITDYSAIQTLVRRNVGSNICHWSEANRLARASTLKGRPGYLANITTAEENEFLRENLNGALNVWMGGSDGTCNGETAYSRLANSFDYMGDTSITERCEYSRNDVGGTTARGNYSSTQTGGTEGSFHWYDGPEAGETFWRYYEYRTDPDTEEWRIWNHSEWGEWADSWRERNGYNTGNEDANSLTDILFHDRPESRYVNWCWFSNGCHEPNNSSSNFSFDNQSGQQGEDNIVFNWNTTDGRWNDLHESEPTVPFYGYIIEYGDGEAFTGVASSTSTLRMNQTITFSGAASSYSTQTINLTAATTTSGLTISYASSDTAVCTVDSSAVVTLIAQGICAITASQAGTADYLAATNVTQTFTSTFGNASTGLITDCTGAGRLENGSFESPEISGTFQNRADASTANNGGISWRTTAGDNQIEIWRNPTPLGSAYNTAQGSQFAELNANSFAGLYQDIATIPGTGIRWSLEHRGRARTDKMRVLIGSASGTTSYSPTSGSAVTVPGTFSDSLGEFATPTSGGATRDISDGSNSWGQWRGNYVVPAGQTTTRFLFISFDPASGSTGNLLDNITFTPTIACPDTTSIISGRSGVNFNVTTNDFFPANSTVSVVSITGTGSATVSGTNLSLSSSSPGSYSVRYRITNPDNDTSESTVNVTVLSESSPRLPDVLLVDPRTNSVDFPIADFANATNLLVCVQESDSNGNIENSPTVSFDVSAKGTTESTGEGSTTISGDRTSTLLLRHTRENVLSTFNSSGGLRAYLSSGNFTSTKYVRVRTLPVATSTTAVTSATCAEAASSASKTIEIRPLGLTNTIRKATIQLK